MLGPESQPAVPMMPFAPRPKNLYLVYGYKVGVHERNIVLYEKGEDAMKAGISLTMSGDGQKFFAGLHLGTVEATEGEDHKGCDLPHGQEKDDLPWKLEKLGIKVDGAPKLYMVMA
jgi:hypothetical protein